MFSVISLSLVPNLNVEMGIFKHLFLPILAISWNMGENLFFLIFLTNPTPTLYICSVDTHFLKQICFMTKGPTLLHMYLFLTYFAQFTYKRVSDP